MVGNHTVDTINPAGIAGIHWFELRNTGTDWTMYQQGTCGLSDSVNRWMGRIAMDGSGNMAQGFSASSSSIYPSIRYVGRLASDTLGTMGQSMVADADIVEFTPTALGSTTAGTLTWKFDGSDVGLSSTTEDVDALYLMNDGSILVSFRNSFSVTGVSGTDSDLARFTATSWGSTTAGTWSWYFDASDVGLSTALPRT